MPPRNKGVRIALLAGAGVLLAGVALIVATGLLSSVKGSVAAHFAAGWDKLAIEAAFAREGLFGSRAVALDDASYEVRTASGTLLYRGSGATPAVDERQAGNGERIDVTACLPVRKVFTDQTDAVCATTVLTASEKRLRVVSNTVQYARKGAIERPSYQFERVVERRMFGDKNEGWESLGSPQDTVTLKAWVGGDETRAVKLPVTVASSYQDADLSGGDGYSAFDAAVAEHEIQSPDIPLSFQFSDRRNTYPPVQTVFHAKTSEDRLTELRSLSERMGEALVADRYHGGTNVRATIFDWRFDRKTKRYQATTRIDWRGALIATNSYWVSGNIDVSEDGSASNFSVTEESGSIRSLNVAKAAGAIGLAIAKQLFSK